MITFAASGCEAATLSLTRVVLSNAQNPIRYREWPESGLSKFEDIMAALGNRIKEADYFYFFDADVRFRDRVELADVGGDLVGVEHPMYPRYDFGYGPRVLPLLCINYLLMIIITLTCISCPRFVRVSIKAFM